MNLEVFFKTGFNPKPIVNSKNNFNNVYRFESLKNLQFPEVLELFWENCSNNSNFEIRILDNSFSIAQQICYISLHPEWRRYTILPSKKDPSLTSYSLSVSLCDVITQTVYNLLKPFLVQSKLKNSDLF